LEWQLKKGKSDMEILVFALLAITKLISPKEIPVAEPEQFQPFDVQTLDQVYKARVESSRRSSDRQEPYAVQAMS
jgi:hypothetical protein